MAVVGISRSISACKRCRNKKIKCSLEFPKCKACLKANTECVSLDAATGKEIPRSYVYYLENRIRELEEQLKSSKNISIEPDESSNNSNTPDMSSNNKQEDTNSKNKNEDPSNKGMSISFSKLLYAAVHYNGGGRKPTVSTTCFQVKTDPTSIPISSHSAKVALLPPKQQALEFVHLYFSRSNSQLPIFHRIDFLEKYFIPIYGSIPRDSVILKSQKTFFNLKTINESKTWYHQYIEELNLRTKDNPQLNPLEFAHSITPPDCFKVPLFFVNIMFAISSSIYHLQFPDEISQNFKNSALLYVEDVYSSLDRLEALQAMLCLTLFSLMRPCIPGVWYLLGSSLRLCVDLNLHNEANNLSSSLDPYTIDFRRRLFWCCYSLDRQICVYLNRPFGIPEESINVKFFSLLDDEMINKNSTAYELAQFLRNGEPVKSYKHVAIMMIRIRRLQAEILSILYEKRELSRRFSSLTEWLIDIEARLTDWKEKLEQIKTIMDCEFTTEFFYLNYYHAKLMLNGLSPNRFVLTSNDLLDAADAAKGIITTYHLLLNRGALNYTWAVTQNVFTAHMSYLYSIFNDSYVHHQNSLDDVMEIFKSSSLVLGSLVEKCNAASQCLEILGILNQAVLKIKYGFTFTKSDVLLKSHTMRKLPSENDVQNVQAGGNINDNMRRLIVSIPEHMNRNDEDDSLGNPCLKRLKVDTIDPQIYKSNESFENRGFDLDKFFTEVQCAETPKSSRLNTNGSVDGMTDEILETYQSLSVNQFTVPVIAKKSTLTGTVSDLKTEDQNDEIRLNSPKIYYHHGDQNLTPNNQEFTKFYAYDNAMSNSMPLNSNPEIGGYHHDEMNKEGSLVYKMMFEAGAESIWSQFFAQPFKPEDQ
ncbi:hypothetical protein CANINC_001069 [Pichia inconspicua]|uniref:Zn(2)-C6 fungal-type domain-containing protein n=1 Tax=Pichia inconspicua TaxID=52247 RepID=A0A4T0X5T2_9ASCO|nr:hypothetical protein CANINC_001069 [[Candida] inconspicua]